MPKRRPGLKVVSRPGTTTLYLRGTIRGQRIFEAAGTDDPALAEEARATREAELYRAALHGSKPRVAFAAAALDYLRHQSRKPDTMLRVQRIGRHFGAAITCDQIDQARIDRAARLLCMVGAAPATKLREVIGPAKAVLNHAARRGWCDAPRFERVKGGRARTDWLTPAEAEAQIANAASHLQPLLTLLYCAGPRLDEALTLDWERDVDLQHARVTFRDTKNGTDRIAELPTRAIAALATLKHRVGAVFRTQRGEPYRATDDSRGWFYGGQIKTAWRTSIEAAGIHKPVTPHHARHTWASWHYAVHRDPMLLRDDGGWESISQVERYAKLVPAGLKPEIVAFWGTGANLAQVADEGRLQA